jgi:hypothetical protein
VNFATNTIINGGCRGDLDCYYFYDNHKPETMQSRCRSVQADDVFMFLTFIVLAVAIMLAYLRMKKGY